MRTIRVRFTKYNEGAYVSLLDLQRIMGRALRCAGVPAWYSQGFNPHIYMTFAAPLALGHNSVCEAMDFKTESDEPSLDVYKDKLTDALPRGIEVTAIYDANTNHDIIEFAEYEISFADEFAAAYKSSSEKYNDLEIAQVEKHSKRGKKLIDIKEHLKKIEVKGNVATILLPAGNTLNINPELLLEYMQTLGGAPKQYAKILRKHLITKTNENFL